MRLQRRQSTAHLREFFRRAPNEQHDACSVVEHWTQYPVGPSATDVEEPRRDDLSLPLPPRFAGRRWRATSSLRFPVTSAREPATTDRTRALRIATRRPTTCHRPSAAPLRSTARSSNRVDSEHPSHRHRRRPRPPPAREHRRSATTPPPAPTTPIRRANLTASRTPRSRRPHRRHPQQL